MAIHVGCGSWADSEYIGVLYPKGTPANKRLSAYAAHFDRVEVNASYYATPRVESVVEWVAQTPASFTFDIRLHRAFSESPKPTAQKGELVDRVLYSIQPLLGAKKFGAFLLVMPPGFTPAGSRLEELEPVIEKLRPHRLAVELRHRGWIEGDRRAATLTFFRDHKLVWVAVDMPAIEKSTMMPAVDEVTNPGLAYLRLHGRNQNWFAVKSAAERHQYDYQPDELRQIATRVKGLAQKAENVHVTANNHAEDFAPKAALSLKAMLGLPASHSG